MLPSPGLLSSYTSSGGVEAALLLPVQTLSGLLTAQQNLKALFSSLP